MSKIDSIAQGFSNLLTGKEEALSKSRMDICKKCPLYNKVLRTCGVCGCHMPAKSRVPEATCPEKKWIL